jgi:hypothetical protein
MVELLAATVLSTLLFITALAVIRSLSNTGTRAAGEPRGWAAAARRQIEWDLNSAVVFRQDDHGLVLAGYDSLDPATLSPNHLPVTVTYSLRTIGSRVWLVREQTSLDPLSPQLNFSEPVCGDVKAFTITGSYAARTYQSDAGTAANSDDEQDPTPLVFQQLAGFQRTPDRVRIRLDLRTDPAPVMDTVLFLR